jgi:hypothetical protein
MNYTSLQEYIEHFKLIDNAPNILLTHNRVNIKYE